MTTKPTKPFHEVIRDLCGQEVIRLGSRIGQPVMDAINRHHGYAAQIPENQRAGFEILPLGRGRLGMRLRY